jgi:hypothetical protein
VLVLAWSDLIAPAPTVVCLLGMPIGYFGSCAADDAAKMLTFAITRSTNPARDGSAQVRKIDSVSDSSMTFSAAKPLPSAKGPFMPVVVWSKVK